MALGTIYYSIAEPSNEYYFKPVEANYRGFVFVKLVDHMLFKIQPVSGKVLPASLASMFTKARCH